MSWMFGADSARLVKMQLPSLLEYFQYASNYDIPCLNNLMLEKLWHTNFLDNECLSIIRPPCNNYAKYNSHSQMVELSWIGSNTWFLLAPSYQLNLGSGRSVLRLMQMSCHEFSKEANHHAKTQSYTILEGLTYSSSNMNMARMISVAAPIVELEHGTTSAHLVKVQLLLPLPPSTFIVNS